MQRVIFLFSLIAVIGCSSKNKITAPKSVTSTNAIVYDGDRTQSEAAKLLARTEGSAIDAWLKSLGFTPAVLTQAVSGELDGKTAVQLHYVNERTGEHALVQHVYQGSRTVFGAFIYSLASDRSVNGECFTYDKVTGKMIGEPAQYPQFSMYKAPTRIVKRFQNYLICLMSGLGGAAFGSLACGPGYEVCYGASAIATVVGCAVNFWAGVAGWGS